MRIPLWLFVWILPLGVWGQSAPERLAPVVVQDSVVNSDESSEASLRLAGAVTIQSLDRVEQGAAGTLAESLSLIPGVYARSRNQSSQSRFSIRGSGLARNADVRGIALELDGLPLNAADSDFDYLTALEPLAYSHIRVFRSANTEGSVTGNLGGAFDFITKTGRDSETASIRAEFGSFGFYRQHADGGWNTERTDGFASVDNLLLDGWRDQSQQNRQHVTANLGWHGSDGWENRIAFTRVESDEELPGALTLKQIAQNPRQAASSPNPIFDRKRADWNDGIVWNRVSDRFSAPLPEGALNGGVWFSYAEIRNPRNQIFDTNYHDVGTRLSWKRESEIVDRENQFTVTFTPTYAWTEENVYRNLLAARRGSAVDATTKQWFNTDLFLQNRYQLSGSLHWIASLQLGYARRSVSDHLALPGEAPTRDTVDFTVLNPSTGLLWEPVADNREIQFYGNLTRSGEAPTMGDLYQAGAARFVTQNKQTAFTVEAGSRGKVGRFGWEAAVYQAWLENEFLISETFPGSGTFVTRNTPHSSHRGAEIGGNFEFLPQPKTGADSLKLTSAFTWNDFHLENDPLYGNKRLPGAPEFLLQHELRYQHASGWYLAPQLTLQPDGINADYANTLKSDAFTLLGLRAGYEGKAGPQVFFEIQNLTNEHFINEVSVTGNAGGKDQRVFWPSTARAYYAGVSWKW